MADTDDEAVHREAVQLQIQAEIFLLYFVVIINYVMLVGFN